MTRSGRESLVDGKAEAFQIWKKGVNQNGSAKRENSLSGR
jgi:hypothetical protein